MAKFKINSEMKFFPGLLSLITNILEASAKEPVYLKIAADKGAVKVNFQKLRGKAKEP